VKRQQYLLGHHAHLQSDSSPFLRTKTTLELQTLTVQTVFSKRVIEQQKKKRRRKMTKMKNSPLLMMSKMMMMNLFLLFPKKPGSL
jgi:hypothetical protein